VRTATSLSIAAAVVLLASRGATAQVARPEMCGRWQGSADVAVNWTKARTLTVAIAISSDDRVTGTIGDATLRDAHLLSNRGWLGKALRIKTDYLIDGRLEGPMIRDEHLVRSEIMMPLDWTGSEFVGAIGTNGTKTGDAETMAFTAKVQLHRAPDMVVCAR
jgi:hypothetical protein